jgi:tetratricopeptide (TPR) repeat protein
MQAAAFVTVGIRALHDSNPACARTQFQAAAAVDPGSPAAWEGLGESEQALHQNAAAEESFQRSYALDPDSLPAVTHLAALLEQQKLTSASVTLWRIAAKLRPDDPRIRFSLADALLANGANQEAEPLLQALLAQNLFDRGAVLTDLGTALARLGRYDEAAKEFSQALAYPEAADTARLSLIKALCTLLRYPQAKPYAEQYLHAHPRDYEALYFMGLIDAGVGEDAAAQQELQSAVAADPRQFDGQLQLGEALRHNGHPGAAIEPLQAAVALKPDSKDAHFQLARAFGAAGRPIEAKQQYSLLQQQEQAGAAQMQMTVLDNQAAAAIAHNDSASARAIYQQLLKLDPRDPKTLYDLAMLHLQEGEATQARACLEQAHALDPTFSAANAELGYLDMVAGDLPKAEAELQAALRANPQSAEALGNLGVLDAKESKPQAAIRNLQLAVESNPGYARGYLNLGLVLAGVGRNAEALAALRQSVALDPQDRGARQALALVQKSTPAP